MNRRGFGRRRGLGRPRTRQGRHYGNSRWDSVRVSAVGPSSSSLGDDVSVSSEAPKSDESQTIHIRSPPASEGPPRPHVDQSLCASCGVCMRVCPAGAISMDGPFAVIDQQRCVGCGVCIRACPRGAIKFGS